jgi:hypothetical protein
MVQSIDDILPIDEILSDFTAQRILFRNRLAQHKKMTEKTASAAIDQAYLTSINILTEYKKITKKASSLAINKAYQRGDFSSVKAILRIFGKADLNTRLEDLEKRIEEYASSLSKEEKNKPFNNLSSLSGYEKYITLRDEGLSPEEIREQYPNLAKRKNRGKAFGAFEGCYQRFHSKGKAKK